VNSPPGRRTGPRQGARPQSSPIATDTLAPAADRASADALAIELNRQVRAFIDDARKIGPLHWYGTAAWAALPHGDPRRNAAVYLAAECWRDHCSVERVAADLLVDLAATEACILRRMKYGSWDISAAADWRAEAGRPSFAELQHRRGVAS
jgi:hypothetical protein